MKLEKQNGRMGKREKGTVKYLWQKPLGVKKGDRKEYELFK